MGSLEHRSETHKKADRFYDITDTSLFTKVVSSLHIIYRVIQGERPVFWEVIIPDIVRKKFVRSRV